MAEEMKVYTVEELAEKLHVTKITIYGYLKSGELEGKKMGKYWRVTEGQLKKFLEG